MNREINFTFPIPEKNLKGRGKKEGGFLNLVLKDKILILKGVLECRISLLKNLIKKSHSPCRAGDLFISLQRNAQGRKGADVIKRICS